MTGKAPSQLDLEALLDAMLALAPEKGWTDAGMKAAAARAGLSDGQVTLAAPNGTSDLIDALFLRAASASRARLAEADMSTLKVRQKVRAGVKAFIAELAPHKAAVKRAGVSGSVMAGDLFAGPKGLWAGADAIWSALGDASTDYNWYTKRAILTGVIGSTLACWAGTDDEAAIDAFLDRRIEDVMTFEKTKKKVQDFVAGLPNPLDLAFGKPR